MEVAGLYGANMVRSFEKLSFASSTSWDTVSFLQTASANEESGFWYIVFVTSGVVPPVSDVSMTAEGCSGVQSVYTSWDLMVLWIGGVPVDFLRSAESSARIAAFSFLIAVIPFEDLRSLSWNWYLLGGFNRIINFAFITDFGLVFIFTSRSEKLHYSPPI